ncbi:imidazole glycerol phosphate synthase subunit HisH [Gammaproteobacteria bacterium AB-CW1]|uniref:Imidazole glycerol phosphate synthase subunit HisH n=1 Tax=Natronospira elongata TaxID=3110268 RepID=A0AAP6MMB9_9GAMM|nr:imidazole glycerol phosphate synthase subunit HisH [Gammaproteobacteria bacterium AB-CW1]
MNRIAVIDYGMGNLHSMAKALEKVAPRSRVVVTADADELARADRIVFPGVGAMAACMSELQRLDLVETVRRLSRERPFLGVCLGMQALFGHSEESGGQAGLGILPGRVRGFSPELAETHGLKIPHMGWNRARARQDHPLWSGLDAPWFYFVHSFYCQPDRDEDVLAECDYGQAFCCAVAHENVVAVQFHPEKSQAAGLRLLSNFVEWRPETGARGGSRVA